MIKKNEGKWHLKGTMIIYENIHWILSSSEETTLKDVWHLFPPAGLRRARTVTDFLKFYLCQTNNMVI